VAGGPIETAADAVFGGIESGQDKLGSVHAGHCAAAVLRGGYRNMTGW
jgi:hypothetical protein